MAHIIVTYTEPGKTVEKKMRVPVNAHWDYDRAEVFADEQFAKAHPGAELVSIEPSKPMKCSQCGKVHSYD